MRKPKQVLSAKGLGALVQYAALTDQEPLTLERTSRAIQSYYTALTKAGYEWDRQTLAWELNPAKATRKAKLSFVLEAEDAQAGQVWYMILESLKAQGFEGVKATSVRQMGAGMLTRIAVEVDP